MVNLDLFVAEDEGRYSIHLPWVTDDGFKNATNGRWLVRVKSDEPVSTGGKWPSIPPLMKDMDMSAESAELPPFEASDNKCYKCRGAGTRIFKCPDCGGDGQAECDMGHFHECEDCDGEGKFETKGEGDKCGYCIDGKAPKNVALVGGAMTSGPLLMFLTRHIPGMKYLPSQVRQERPIPMVFPDGQVLLMPVSE